MAEDAETADRPHLLDWATGVTRDHVQGIAETNQGVSKEHLKAAAAALAAIGPMTDPDATADELQSVRRDLEATAYDLHVHHEGTDAGLYVQNRWGRGRVGCS